MVPLSASEKISSHIPLPGLICILYIPSLPAQVEKYRCGSSVFSGRLCLASTSNNSPSAPVTITIHFRHRPSLHMMGVPNEKATMAVGQPDSPEPWALSAPDVTNVGDSDSIHSEKPVHGMSDDKYPHGLNLVLLAGASITAVFLIALDQVITPPTDVNTVKNTSNTKGV
jgi:hypothetical protein